MHRSEAPTCSWLNCYDESSSSCQSCRRTYCREHAEHHTRESNGHATASIYRNLTPDEADKVKTRLRIMNEVFDRTMATKEQEYQAAIKRLLDELEELDKSHLELLKGLRGCGEGYRNKFTHALLHGVNQYQVDTELASIIDSSLHFLQALAKNDFIVSASTILAEVNNSCDLETKSELLSLINPRNLSIEECQQVCKGLLILGETTPELQERSLIQACELSSRLQDASLNVECLKSYACALTKQNKPATAFEIYRKCWRLQGANLEEMLNCAKHIGKTSIVCLMFGQIRKRCKSHLPIQIQKDSVLMKALEAFWSLEKKKAEELDSHGLNLIREAQFDKAIPVFEEASELWRNQMMQVKLAVSLEHLGDCQLEVGEFSASANTFEEVIAMSCVRKNPKWLMKVSGAYTKALDKDLRHEPARRIREETKQQLRTFGNTDHLEGSSKSSCGLLDSSPKPLSPMKKCVVPPLQMKPSASCMNINVFLHTSRIQLSPIPQKHHLKPKLAPIRHVNE